MLTDRTDNCLAKVEQMRMALRHEEPDRVPVSNFFWQTFIDRLRKDLGLVPDADISKPVSPHSYGCKGNDGDEIWEKLVRKHRNIFLVLIGHILNDGLGKLTSIGDKGNQVHQILANYQMKKNGGNGWLRIMKFLPAENKIIIPEFPI